MLEYESSVCPLIPHSSSIFIVLVMVNLVVTWAVLVLLNANNIWIYWSAPVACIYILHIAPYKSDQSIFVRHYYLLNHYWAPRSPRNFKFQINVGGSGATDVITYLRLIKITNFLWPLPEATQKKNFFFSQFTLVAKILELLLMWMAWAYVLSVRINFGEVFRKRNIHAKMIFVKQKKSAKAESK